MTAEELFRELTTFERFQMILPWALILFGIVCGVIARALRG